MRSRRASNVPGGNGRRSRIPESMRPWLDRIVVNEAIRTRHRPGPTVIDLSPRAAGPAADEWLALRLAFAAALSGAAGGDRIAPLPGLFRRRHRRAGRRPTRDRPLAPATCQRPPSLSPRRGARRHFDQRRTTRREVRTFLHAEAKASPHEPRTVRLPSSPSGGGSHVGTPRGVPSCSSWPRS